MLQRYRTADSGQWKRQGLFVKNGSSKSRKFFARGIHRGFASVLLVLRPEESENGFHLNNRYCRDFLKINNPNAFLQMT